MFKLNRKVEYALMALKALSDKRPGEKTSVKTLSEQTGASFDVLSRVMQSLVQKDILRSEQGAHGGYSIQKDLGKVSFYDVAQAVLGSVDMVKCLSTDPNCELSASCNIKSPVQELNRQVIQFYKSMKILDLIQIKKIAVPLDSINESLTQSLNYFSKDFDTLEDS